MNTLREELLKSLLENIKLIARLDRSLAEEDFIKAFGDETNGKFYYEWYRTDCNRELVLFATNCGYSTYRTLFTYLLSK